MKNHVSSKNAVIRSEGELTHHFRQLLKVDKELKWRTPAHDSIHSRPEGLELKLDATVNRFKLIYSLKPSIPELQSIITNWSGSIPPLLVAPELVPRILEFCREKRFAAIDLNGRAYVRGKGLLVDRGALPGRNFRFELEPRNVFVGKSASIVRTLLTDRDRAWVQSELVSRTKASSGLVSRIVQHLISQNYLEKQSAREFRIRDPFGLIDAWVKADDFNRRAQTTRYSVFANDPLGIARELNHWAKDQSVAIAFTQWVAAWLRHPYTEPAIASAYVARLPEPATLKRLDLRMVDDAGKIWLHVPIDEGVFLETKIVKGFPIVSDAQIYLDLQQTGLRGPEQASALRHWEGFCRP